MALGQIELPTELWARILQDECHFAPNEMKQLCFVCRLFRDICQASLFQSLTLSPNVGVDYKSHGAGYGPPANRRQWSAEVHAWDWVAWEGDMRRTIRSERRLDTLGNHSVLGRHLRNLMLKEYGLRWYRYPSNPFERPLERRVLTRAVYDELFRFQNTLIRHLPHFTQLRRLELLQYAVDQDLLGTMESHPTLREVKFDFCWFPKDTSPLKSITFMAFRHIPTTQGLNTYWIPPTGPSPFQHVPDHHIVSGYELISPETVEELDITFGAYDSDVRRFVEHFSSRMRKAEFRRLHKVNLHSTFYPQETPILLRQMFESTPVLRELHITESHSLVVLEGTFPLPYMPRLENLTCPLPWAQFLVPGRPVTNIKVWLVEEAVHKVFLAPTEPELNALLRPLTLSTSPITTLHLPTYPPLAPVWFLLRYLAAMFPALRDLRAAVAGEKMNVRHGGRCGSRAGPPLPCIDTAPQMVEGGLVENLTAEVRKAVESEFSETATPVLLPIGERIMTFRKATGTMQDSEPVGEANSIRPMRAYRQNMMSSRPSEYRRPEGMTSSVGFSMSTRDVEMPHGPRQHPLVPLQARFDTLNTDRFPVYKPEILLDVLIFLARGHYPLPPFLQSLTLINSFGKVKGYSSRWSHIQDEKDYELCLQTALTEVSQRHTELSSYNFADDGEYGLGSYRRLYRRRKEDWVWYQAHPHLPKWEVINHLY